MIADLWVYELGDVILLTMPRDVKDTVLAKLDQFIFTEDVQLGDVTGTFAQCAVVGPGAAQVVAERAGGVSADALRRSASTATCARTFGGQPAIVAARDRHRRAGVRRLRGTPMLPALREMRCIRRARIDVDAATAETLRIEAGVPQLSSRHGRRDDPARSRDRVARHQPHQRVLRRSGSDHPRAASRPRPRRAKARRSGLEEGDVPAPARRCSAAAARSAT